MFLDEKLSKESEKLSKEGALPMKSILMRLLNVCVEHIAEKINTKRLTYNVVFMIVKGVDNEWRSWTKKNGLKDWEEAFRRVYIVPRMSKLPNGDKYFDITETEKYGLQ